MTSLYANEIRMAAAKYSVDPRLITAMVLVESSDDPFAWNPEPRYHYLWDVRARAPFRRVTDAELAAAFPPADFPVLSGDRDQEWWAQRASWGLLQIMGALAREYGYRQAYLTALVDPATNLEVGCRHVAALLKWSEGDVLQAVAAFNGGKTGNVAVPYRNQKYADKVLTALSEVN